MIAKPPSFIFACIIIALIKLSFMSSLALSEEVTVVRNKDKGLWDKDNARHIDFIKDLTIGSDEGNKNTIFGAISGIAVDSRYNIYVLDYSNCRVQVFDSSGSFMLSIGRRGNGPGEFSFPTAININEFDEIFIADRNMLDVFDIEGGYITSHQLKASSPIRDVKIDSDGNFYVTYFEVFEQKIIHKYNFQGKHLLSFCDSYAKDKDVDVRIESAFAGGHIDIDEYNIILYTQMIPYEIRRFTLDGKFLSRIYRDNTFMKSPDEYVEVSDDGVRFSTPTVSSSITVLSNEMFINVASIPQDPDEIITVVDVFSSNGQFLTSKKFERPIVFKCTDNKGYLYAIDNKDYAKAVRFKIVMN